MELKPKSQMEIEGIVQTAIKDAVDFVESEISENRIKAQRYMDGQVDIGHEEGRSKVVSTKVRDTIRAVKPSLMRVFMSTSRPVEFIPSKPQDVMMCEQANVFMEHEAERLSLFKVLNDAFHDALLKKQGIVKAYWKSSKKAEIYTYTDLTDDEYTYLVADEDVTVLEHSVEESVEIDEMGMDMSGPTHSVKISHERDEGRMCVEVVPPEEIFVNRNARTLQDAYIIAHRTEMRKGDLIEMGYAPEDVMDLDSFDSGSEITEAEDYERRGYSTDSNDEDVQDPAMENVTVTEAYMRMDVDGTGIPVLHKFICGGTGYKVLDFMPCDEIPFAKLEIDPEAHSFYGRSLAEIVIDDQDAATAILRGILDNVALTNNPRIAATDGVNFDDLLNNEIGAIVRMRPGAMVQDLSVPFVAGQTLSALAYLDQMIEQKTGVSRASMGLDPDAMQSTTKAAVQATVQAAAGQVEVMVRNLAEGVKDLFGIMLRLMIKNSNEEQMIQLHGQFVPVDPRVWNSNLHCRINVGLGTGREEERMMALQQALQTQVMVYQTYGPQNGLVSLTNVRNTLADILAASGVRNADRYFAPMSPEIEQQMMAMQAQQQQMMAQQQQDPNAAFLQTEQMKAQTRAQVDMMKAEMENQRKMHEMGMTDDLKRDQMAQDLLVDAAKIYGQYGATVDTARVKAEQEQVRQHNAAMMGMMGQQ